MLFLSDIHRSLPIWIINISGDKGLFKLIGDFNTDPIILRKNYNWDTVDINWSKTKVLVNKKEIRLPLLSPYK